MTSDLDAFFYEGHPSLKPYFFKLIKSILFYVIIFSIIVVAFKFAIKDPGLNESLEKLKEDHFPELGMGAFDLIKMAIYGVFLFLFVIKLLRLAIEYFRIKSTRFRVDCDRVEVEYGIFSKTILNVELWRVKDVYYRESFWLKVFKLSFVEVEAVDRQLPRIHIGPISNGRELYDTLKSLRLKAGRAAGAQAMGTI